jgi:hypothetical protein
MASGYAISGKIGKANHHDSARSATLTVDFPLGAKIKGIRAYFANQPWGAGESAYPPTEFTQTPIVGLNGQPYAEWSSGWAYANFVSQSSSSVTVQFFTWHHENSRNAKLEVEYEPL